MQKHYKFYKVELSCFVHVKKSTMDRLSLPIKKINFRSFIMSDFRSLNQIIFFCA